MITPPGSLKTFEHDFINPQPSRSRLIATEEVYIEEKVDLHLHQTSTFPSNQKIIPQLTKVESSNTDNHNPTKYWNSLHRTGKKKDKRRDSYHII